MIESLSNGTSQSSQPPRLKMSRAYTTQQVSRVALRWKIAEPIPDSRSATAVCQLTLLAPGLSQLSVPKRSMELDLRQCQTVPTEDECTQECADDL